MKLVTLDLLRVFLENLRTSFTAARAKVAEAPAGFSGRLSTSKFGNQDGTCLTEWYSAGGGGIAFRANEGKVNVITSGQFYSGNGNNLVLDAGNYAKFLPVGESGDASSIWNISISGNAATATKALNDDLGRKISDTYVSAAGGAIEGDLHVKGDIYANRVHNVIYNDYAEYFEAGDSKDKIEPGDIVALDESSSKEQYVKATKDSKVIIGVCSDEYAQTIGGTPSRVVNSMYYVPVALMGRVYVKVDGPVHPGDHVVLSDDIPGVGVASKEKGRRVLGTALTSNKDGRGTVRILVNQEL